MLKNTLRQIRHGFNRPFMVMFETTLHCNMKCGYCAIWQNQQPEAVHNVVRTTYQTEDVELACQDLDKVSAYLTALRAEFRCVRFYTDYYKFYRNGGFSAAFPCRSASHLVNIRPDGSVQFPCAVVQLHRGAHEMTLEEIYGSPGQAEEDTASA